MRINPPTLNSVKALADRYYKAQCKRLADEEKARQYAFVVAHEMMHPIAEAAVAAAPRKRGRPRKTNNLGG